MPTKISCTIKDQRFTPFLFVYSHAFFFFGFSEFTNSKIFCLRMSCQGEACCFYVKITLSYDENPINQFPLLFYKYIWARVWFCQIFSNHSIGFVLNAKNGLEKILQRPTKSLLATSKFLVSQQKKARMNKNWRERQRRLQKNFKFYI